MARRGRRLTAPHATQNGPDPMSGGPAAMVPAATVPAPAPGPRPRNAVNPGPRRRLL